MSTPFFACLCFPEFPAQALLRARHLRPSFAAVVLSVEPPVPAACAVTRPAYRRGARHGMQRSELAQIPGLLLIPRSLAQERSTAALLRALIGPFSLRSEAITAGPDYLLALDLSGAPCSSADEPSPQRTSRELFGAVRRLGLFARVATSRDLQTAMSRVATNHSDPSPSHIRAVLEPWGHCASQRSPPPDPASSPLPGADVAPALRRPLRSENRGEPHGLLFAA